MTNILRFARGPMRPTVLALGVAGLALAACNLDVTNPSVIDASTFNPSSDGALISLSAQTQFYQAFQTVARFGGLFAEEHASGAARTETSDIARRNLFAGNQDINTGLFGPLARAVAANENVITALKGGAGAASDLNIARAQMNLAFSLELMAETFCQGVVLGGPGLTPTQLLDSAITRFNQAIATAGAATGTEAVKIVNASKVGLARTYLQKGDNANAVTASTAALASVPNTFAFNVPTVDDAANRLLGNQLYRFSVNFKQMVVTDVYRALNDPRISWIDGGSKAEDGILQDYQQQKFKGWAVPVRIASYLEAQYVQAEAKLKTGDPAPALALIAARRRVGGDTTTFTGTATPAILTELLSQSARDFWLEGKKLGDWRRNGAAEPYISAPGTLYKGSLNFGTLTSVPLPQEETNSNLNHLTACP